MLPKSTSDLIDHISELYDVPGMLGANPTEERFRAVTYALSSVAFQLRGEEPLGWNEFIDNYLAMYPEGIPELRPRSALSMASLAPDLPELTAGLPPISRAGRAQKGGPTRDLAQ